MRRRDIIDILSEWDIVHVPYMTDYGYIKYDTRRIFINEENDMMTIRGSVIHELLHAHYNRLGIDRTEDQIESEESKLMKNLYKNGKHRLRK